MLETLFYCGYYFNNHVYIDMYGWCSMFIRLTYSDGQYQKSEYCTTVVSPGAAFQVQ